ncbi:MAG: hypothetical protein U5R14_05420 [Gemmatimonadota bacterium]|nr:hypothetical protein [Gemmatimonadota bacterium]
MTNELRSGRPHAPKLAALAAVFTLGLAACGGDPFSFNWSDEPDTVVLHSLARPEMNLLSGYNFFEGSRVPIESPNATGAWDVALDTRGDEMVFLPPGALGVSSRARIAVLEGLGLDDVVEAPNDSTEFVSDVPVTIRLGTTYVVKTGQRRGSFGRNCVYYAKLEPIALDVADGRLTFHEVTNPVCNNRSLIPPD